MRLIFLWGIFFLMPSLSMASPSFEEGRGVYKLRFMWVVPIGEAHISFKSQDFNKEKAYKISASYDSPSWASLFFKLKGEVASFVDSETHLPMRYEETYSYTGHPHQYHVLSYDQKNGKVSIDRNGEKEDKSIPLPTLDPLSALYFLKQKEWSKGVVARYNLNSHQSNYELELECVHEEKIKFNHKLLDTWVLKGTLKRSDLLHLPPKAEFTTWISQDHKRLPLKMKLKTKIGFLSLTLDPHF